MRFSQVLRQVLPTAALFIGLAVGAGAQTSDVGTVTGKLTINGKTEPLRYVYAMSERDVNDPKKEEIRIVLTNQPLPERVTNRLTPATFMGFREENKTRLWGLFLELRPPEKRMNFLAVIGPIGGTTQSPVLQLQPQKLALTTYKPDRVVGKLTMTRDDTFAFAPEGMTERPTYRFEAAFDVPVRALPVPVTLTGAAARDSDPAKAVAGFIEAARRGDTNAIRRYLSAPVAKQLSSPNSLDMLTAFQRMGATLKMEQLSRVLISGDNASVEFKMGKDDTASLEMVREKGEWKIGA
jgi:hypothetical protein